MANKHIGSNFDDFLKEDGIYDEVVLKAYKKVISLKLEDIRNKKKMTKQEMAKRMKTNRSTLNRLLDPDCYSIKLETVFKAARVLDVKPVISFEEVA